MPMRSSSDWKANHQHQSAERDADESENCRQRTGLRIHVSEHREAATIRAGRDHPHQARLAGWIRGNASSSAEIAGTRIDDGSLWRGLHAQPGATERRCRESGKAPKNDPGFVDKWRSDWQKLFSGENAGATAILWGDAKYNAISSLPNDAQYVETLKQLDADFCGVFGVPLQLISSQDKAPTYASSEQFSLQFIMYTGAPLAEDFEQEFNKKLFPTEPNVFCKMDLDSLMRGDSKSQAEVFATLVTHGIIERNIPRRKMNLPEVPYANKLTIQANMVDLDKLPDLSAAATPNLVQGDIRKELPENHVHVSTPMAEEQMARVVKEITTAAATSKRKRIQLVKAADGTTTGATVTEE
jgi:hypothetical protein